MVDKPRRCAGCSGMTDSRTRLAHVLGTSPKLVVLLGNLEYPKLGRAAGAPPLVTGGYLIPYKDATYSPTWINNLPNIIAFG